MRYGPFPIRAGRLLGGTAAVVVGIPVIALVAWPDRVHCPPASSTCHVQRTLQHPLEFSRADFVTVHVARSFGRQKRPVARPVLVLRTREIGLRIVEPATAESFARRAEEAFRAGGAVDLALNESWWLAVFLGVMPIAGAWMLMTAFRGIGRYRIEHDGGRRELVVTRTVFFVPVSRRTVSTSDVVDVDVEWARDKDSLHGRYDAGDTTARLVLLTADGKGRPVNDAMHRGYTLHRRAAAELGALLGCRAPSRDIAERREADALAHRPPPGSFGGGNRFFAAWIGLCCGTLLGLAVYGLGGIALGLLHGSDPVDEYALVFGAGGGAVSGIALAFYLTRPREPR